jgi:alpha-1,3-rhamnosyl/mannosyltransferase
MFQSYWGASRIIEESGCDVVYYPYTLESLHRPTRAGRIVTVHDLLPLAYPRVYPRTVQLWRRLLLPLLRGVDAVITPSVNTREGLIVQGGFERWRLRVIPQGFRPMARTGPRERLRAVDPYILYVSSSHYPYKNNEFLLRVFDAISQRIPHRLVIVAKHDRRFTPALEAHRLTSRVRDRIELRDEVNEADLRQLYEDASLFVYPSEFEGFGIPPLEAMAAGVPVVASNAASIPEVCGTAAEYFAPWNEGDAQSAILSVLNEPARQHELRQAGSRRAAEFSWSRTAAHIIQLAQEVVACATMRR